MVVDNTCSICQEAWIENGNHQLASLHCGHVFGESCIQRWLSESDRCPICNQEAFRDDVRKIFLHTTRPSGPAPSAPPAAYSQQARSPERNDTASEHLLSEELQILQSRCEFLESKNESLEEQLQDLEEICQRFTEDNDQLQDQIDGAKELLHDAECRLEEESTKCIEAIVKADWLEEQLQNRMEQLEISQGECQFLKEQIDVINLQLQLRNVGL